MYSVALLCLCVVVVAGQLSVPEPPDCGFGCVNGAPCEWVGEDGRYNCICSQGYTGMFCETQMLDCRYDGECYNGGSCETVGDEAWCSCTEGFTGHSCETYMVNCQEYGCHNGGACQMDYDGSYSCSCQPGFAGRQCETALPPCESCKPDAECPWGAPRGCDGYNCPVVEPMLRCHSCEGDMKGDLGRRCHDHPEEGVTTLCALGCKTSRHTTDAYDWISRGCDWGECWNECKDYVDDYDGKPGRACTECCHDRDHCNTHRPTDAGAIAALSTVTASLACLMAIVLA